jgi:hypothetical protein
MIADGTIGAPAASASAAACALRLYWGRAISLQTGRKHRHTLSWQMVSLLLALLLLQQLPLLLSLLLPLPALGRHSASRMHHVSAAVNKGRAWLLGFL